VCNCRLLYVDCRAAPCLPIRGVPDDGFESFPVAPRSTSCDPRCEVVYDGYRTAMAVDASLYQVRVEEEEQDWG